MLADVVRPCFYPVVFHVLDGIDAEPVTVRGVDEVFESLGDPVGNMRALGPEVVRALELAVNILRISIPIIDGAVVMEMSEIVEGVWVAAGPPPAEGVVARRPI